jgi:non-heme chloroperoxidase
MAFIQTTDGTNLFYRDWGKATAQGSGKGEAMLFVASQSVSSDMWNYNVPFFADGGFRTIAYDRRGHGRSDQPGEGYDMETLVGDLRAVIERLDLRDLVLVGHSMGGAEVIRYLSRYAGDRVRRAVLLSPTAPFMTRTDDNPEGVDPALFESTRLAWKKDFPGWVADNAAPFFTPETSPALTKWGVGLLASMPLYLQLRIARTTTGTDLRRDLARIAVPTLFLHGELDASVPIAFGRRAAALVPGSRFKAYHDAAHGLPITHADRANKDILEFVRA